MKNYGTLIKKIRIEKGLSQKDIYEGIMTRQTYYLIESNVSMPSFDKFLLILEKLFLSIDEFLSLLNPTIFPNEKLLYQELAELTLNKDKNGLYLFIKNANRLYKETENKKYWHLQLIAESMFHIHFEEPCLIETKSLEELMLPIKKYLIGIETWHVYELKLLNNSLYCFTLDEAISLVTLIGTKLETLSYPAEFQDVKLRIYLNLSFLCLKHQNYSAALHFSALAKESAQINYRLFERIVSELNYEIAHSLMEKHECLSPRANQLIQLLQSLDFTETVKEYQEILEENHLY